MNLAATYDRVINWPNHTALMQILAGGVGVVVIAAIILATGKIRWLGRCLGLVGLGLIVYVLFIVPQQTIKRGWLNGRQLTSPRYSSRVRIWSTAALVGVPSAGAAIMLSVLLSTQRRMRAIAPRYAKTGRREFVRKDYAAALRAYNKSLELAPIVGDTHCQRGLVHQAMGQTELALADFERALELDPRAATALLWRARIRTDRGALDQALDDLNRVMVLRGSDPEVYLHRGTCFFKKGMLNEARSDFQRVLKLTNHSDFADPAKSYLRDLEARAQSFPAPPGANGAAAQPKAQDYIR
jgi:Tfp pilus assembly protein PilF